MLFYKTVFFFQAEDGIRDRSPSRGLGLGNVSPLLIQISHLLFILSYMRKLRFSYFLTVFMPFVAFSRILESNANVLAFFSFAPANASSISLFVSCLKLMPVGSNK